MFAKDFFAKVEKYCNAGCSGVKINVAGTPMAKLRHSRDVNGYANVPEELLLFVDLYPVLETYMYARFVANDVIELVDSNNREPYDLVIEDVSQDGDDVVKIILHLLKVVVIVNATSTITPMGIHLGKSGMRHCWRMKFLG